MVGELDRLRKLYAEMGDEHLLDLAKAKDDLMPDAQIALIEELQRRNLAVPVARATHDAVSAGDSQDRVPEPSDERSDGFGVGVPGFFPGAGPAVEQALEPGGETRMGMVGLISFFDGLELARACEALEDADIEPAIEEVAGDATIGTTSRFEVWVSAADAEQSKVVLRRRMGLFPLGEVENDGTADLDGGDDADRVVAEFDSVAEAEQVRDLLLASGFTASLEQNGPERGSSVVVPAEQYERALALLAERLQVE